MVKPLQRAEVKTFSGGLITDSPYLAFPENASVDECNFDNNYDGSRSRRKGLQELGRGLIPSSANSVNNQDDPITYMWEAPGGDVSINILVTHSGQSIAFYDATKRVPFQHPLEYKIEPLGGGITRLSFATVAGYLVAVGGETTFVIYEYNTTTRQIKGHYYNKYLIRDVFGVEDIEDPMHNDNPTYRSYALSPYHYYNLYNQGWAIPRLPWKFGDHPTEDAVAMAAAPSPNNPAGKYPSNADTVWQGMDVRNIGRETVESGSNQSYVYTSAEAFNQSQYITALPTGAPAAKGYFIINAFDRGWSRSSAWSLHKSFYPQTGSLVPINALTFKTDHTQRGPSCVESHAGRAFYSGIKAGAPIDGDNRSPNWTSTVFFSKVVDTVKDFGICYPEGDPTSREASDVVDTDGGFINISGATNIHSLVSFGNYLLVLAENGVWSISGDNGFTATSFKVNKISNFGCANKEGVVRVGGAVFYLGAFAMYRAALNQFGDVEVNDVTTQLLSSFYKEIPHACIQSAIGAADLQTNTAHWLIYEKEHDPTFVWNLRFDTARGCFIPMKIALPQGRHIRFIGMHQTPSYSKTITNTGGAVVGSFVMCWILGNFDLQAYVHTEFSDENFKDWAGIYGTGVDAEAYLQTGAVTAGDVAVKKQIPYLTLVFKNKERGDVQPGTSKESSCLGRIMWDFSDKITSNRWSREMQMFRLPRAYMDENGFIDNGQDVIITKSKLRGNGKAMSLRLSTEPGKDCHIVGWSLTLTGNGVT